MLDFNSPIPPPPAKINGLVWLQWPNGCNHIGADDSEVFMLWVSVYSEQQQKKRSLDDFRPIVCTVIVQSSIVHAIIVSLLAQLQDTQLIGSLWYH